MKGDLTTIEKVVKGQIEKHVKDASKSPVPDENAERMLRELEQKLESKKK